MKQIGLWDQSFRPDPSSTRWRTPAEFEFVRDVAHWDGVAVMVDGHALMPDECDAPVKIAWLHEPPCLGEMHRVYNDIMHISHHYDRVLTYDKRLLSLDSHYHLLPYGGVWIPESDWGLRPKTKLCSMLIGIKNETHGHKLRHEIAPLVADIVDFYGIRGEPVGYERGTKLRVNGDYAFSIVTETCRIDNLFTEWLLDCFAVGTVPVYWGCPDIVEFFDPGGILNFTTVAECVNIVQSLSKPLYRYMLPAVKNNFEMMKQYACPDNLMFDKYLREYFQ